VARRRMPAAIWRAAVQLYYCCIIANDMRGACSALRRI
jgi:hypothetical protein